ncbi:hypothetical protein, partial [Bradyrhizobium sp. CCH5-F6]|uniref:hypothetical protein n=1 Tax=Bradyrhizobium sp. CCH5-F6 TaxID=1768753 RepID=UPI001AEC9485
MRRIERLIYEYTPWFVSLALGVRLNVAGALPPSLRAQRSNLEFLSSRGLLAMSVLREPRSRSRHQVFFHRRLVPFDPVAGLLAW